MMRAGDWDDDEEIGSVRHGKWRRIFTRRYIIYLIIFYFVLYFFVQSSSLSSGFSFSIQDESEVRVKCTTIKIEAEKGIRAGSLSYGNAEKIEIQLYTVSLTRSINCIDTNEVTHLLQYKDDYLNISTVDVDSVFHALTLKYPIGESFDAFHYKQDCYKLSRVLDRNCLVENAINPEEYDNLTLYYLYRVMVHFSIIAFITICVMIHIMLRDNARKN